MERGPGVRAGFPAVQAVLDARLALDLPQLLLGRGPRRPLLLILRPVLVQLLINLILLIRGRGGPGSSRTGSRASRASRRTRAGSRASGSRASRGVLALGEGDVVDAHEKTLAALSNAAAVRGRALPRNGGARGSRTDSDQSGPAAAFSQASFSPRRSRSFSRSSLSVAPFVSPFCERERERERLRSMVQLPLWLAAQTATTSSPALVTAHEGTAATRAAPRSGGPNGQAWSCRT